MRFEARAACGVVAIVFGTLGTACRNDDALNTSSAPVPQSVAARPAQAPEQIPSAVVGFTPPPPAYLGELPPFPTSPYAPPRPPELIKAIYTFAARHPEVLHYVPCFCGCQRSGHSNNDDCFIQGREANGKPKWDPHGMTWGICLDVARDAMQMHNSGASVAKIRSTIEATYKSQYETMTPTSPPPK